MPLSVQALIDRTPSQRWATLAQLPEGQWFERKSLRAGLDVIARSIIGFANAEGGLLAIGLSEGHIEGADARKLGALRRVPRTHCAPPPLVHFHEVRVEHDGRTGTVLIAEVEPGQTLHETTAGECFLRVGDATVRLNANQREELAYDRGGAQYEARPIPGVTVNDLDPGHLDQLRRALGTRNPLPQMLAARSLLTIRAEVTVAAYLLFAAHPEHLMPHAHVRVLRHLTAAAGTGSRQNVADGGDVRVEGPLSTVIQDAVARIDDWMPRRRALQADGRFGPVPVVPRDAWLEGLVNAVVHRSYSMAGDHIRVAVFPDRIEIESPGRFPGIVDPTRPLDICRYARNPRIARVCNDLGFTQEKGEGIRRIFDEMRRLGLADPIYRQTSGSVRLILLGTPRLAPELLAGLPGGAPKVLEALRTSGRAMGTGDIAEAIGVQRPATLRALKALQDLGEVIWHGKSSKDPRATWSLPHGTPDR